MIFFVLLIVMLFPAASAASSTDPVTRWESHFRFSHITREAGVSGLPEYGGHAMAWADVNGDGRDDACVTNNFDAPSLPDLLYLNTGKGGFVECAQERGVQDNFPVGSHGVAFGDFDGDGDYDLFNGTTGGPDHLYRNDGRGRFTDVSSEAGISSGETSTRGVLFADFDGDGDLDIFICTPSPPSWQGRFPAWDGPTNIPRFYINRGDGTFSREYRGVPFLSFEQGCTAADFDRDGDEDLFVCRWATPSLLYRNDGKGRFAPCSEEVGLPVDGALNLNGATFGDIDNDGDLDLILGPWPGNKETCEVYVNEDGARFRRSQRLSAQGFTPMLADLDNDGDLDLYTGAHLFSNDGKGVFHSVPLGQMAVPFNDPRCSATADFDNDGDLDVFLVCKRSQNFFFRNEINNGNWLKVKLMGRGGVAGGFGSYVWVYDAGHSGEKPRLRGTRYAQSAYGYLGQHSPILHFGVDSGQEYDVGVRFLDGAEATVSNVRAGTTVVLRHPSRP
jgi:hypothetical protein